MTDAPADVAPEPTEHQVHVHDDPGYKAFEAAIETVVGLVETSVKAGMTDDQITAEQFAPLGLSPEVIDHIVQHRMRYSMESFAQATSQGMLITNALAGITGAAYADGILTGYIYAQQVADA